MDNGTEKLLLEVQGIFCQGCAMDMETLLKDMDGIEKVEVNYSTGTIHLEYNPEEISRETLFAKVSGFGFKTRIVEDK